MNACILLSFFAIFAIRKFLPEKYCKNVKHLFYIDGMPRYWNNIVTLGHCGYVKDGAIESHLSKNKTMQINKRKASLAAESTKHSHLKNDAALTISLMFNKTTHLI